MSRRRLAVLLALGPLALPSAARSLPSAALAHARLAGQFTMAGRITAAHAVRGERVGDRVVRTWNFIARCPAGQCETETLVRSRAMGTDTLTLRRKGTRFGHWTGRGSFFAPLRCGSHTYPRGERVRFRIIVEITGTTLVNGAPVATVLKATYASYRRTNRTRCVSALGHDAAVYTGTPVTPAPPPPPPTPAPTAPTPAPS